MFFRLTKALEVASSIECRLFLTLHLHRLRIVQRKKRVQDLKWYLLNQSDKRSQ